MTIQSLVGGNPPSRRPLARNRARQLSLLCATASVLAMLSWSGHAMAQQIVVPSNASDDVLARRALQMNQDRDSDLDDENNLILNGAADADFNSATKSGGGEDKQAAPEVDQELEAIRAKLGKTNINVNKDSKNAWETNDIKERYEKGNIHLALDSITPRAGPTTGATRVTVRAAGLEDLVDAFPDPKCRFGTPDKTVDAVYVRCTQSPLKFYSKERGADAIKNSTCIECESAPASTTAEIVTFAVSLTGKFDDVHTTLPYRFYKQAIVSAIYPRYGPKDGDTVVQVWGENFLDLGDDFRCNFGTRSTKAYLIDEGYLWCRAPHSDVVSRPMPFSVSLNRQQNSRARIEYWYYNAPTITQITPDFGPVGGGTKVTLKGSDYLPFDWKLDVNNKNDTFCSWGVLGKTPAEVISSTEAECVSPPDTAKLDFTHVNLTLNNQNYTEEYVKFYYFNPPKIMDAQPLLGPVKGGTEVNLWGTKFEKQKNITCSFGGKVVRAKYISKTHVVCVAPSVKDPGDAKLTVKYENDRFQSDVLTFTYFDSPEITAAPTPACGPTKGFTQFTLHGKNFVEFGFGTAKCIFNGTIQMNATVLDKTKIVCDSPPLDSQSGDMFYNVSVTLDGEYTSNANQQFVYYDEPVIETVSPWLGPIAGNTVVTIGGRGFTNAGICDLKVRFGQYTLTPRDVTKNSLTVDSPAAHVPGQVVVSVSGNNQQYVDDRTLHFRDKENTFEYYQQFLIEKASPAYLSNAGNSPLTLTGVKFDQFKNDDGSIKKVPLLCRFTDSSNTIVGQAKTMTRKSQNEQVCVAPKTDITGEVKVEISANGQQWQDTDSDVKFYNGPRVTSINPTRGVTKNPKGLKLSIYGDNFQCPNGDCSKIKVRFMNKNKDQIFVAGKMSESGTVICEIPKYPAPETLDVDVSFNGLDFTNDGVKYGFFDPAILDIKPRLVSPRGTTQLTISGYGFVAMDEAKSMVVMKSKGASLLCNGAECRKVYSVESENKARVDTYEQSAVMKTGGGNIGNEAWNVDMMNPDGDFAPNNIALYYYKEPVVTSVSSGFAFANEEKPIIIKTQFHFGAGNDIKVFKKYGNLTCRFTSVDDQSRQVVTAAIFEQSPIGQYKKDALPDQIRCRTPKWGRAEATKLDVSINGQDYFGAQQLQFVEELVINKISPLSGPIGGNTKVTLFAQGINSSIPVSSAVYIKFGTHEALKVDKPYVSDISFYQQEYHDGLHLDAKVLKRAEENDASIDEGSKMLKYMFAKSPDLSRQYEYLEPDVLGMGGPVAVQIGERVALNITDHEPNSPTFRQQKEHEIDVVFKDSSRSEFYFYRQPIVKKIEPTAGLIDGGTVIDITGAWFDEKPQYGVFPFCKIGNVVTRGRFIQTTRMQCKSPPSGETLAPQPVAVSLNGVDFVDTGFTFSYYQKPILLDIVPRSGSVEGGTEIWLKGEKFSNVTNGLKTVKCRFTQILPEKTQSSVNNTDDVEPIVRYMPAYIISKEMMKCASPAGWTGGDQVKVDLTFNGVDYTDNAFTFSFYNIFGSFPKSGPSTAVNQFIQIRGKGFRSESTVLCSLNNTKTAPLAVHPGIIKCPMVVDGVDATRLESVPFAILIDGSKFSFGSFRYYKQIEIDTVTPLIGPQEGRGAIYIIGKDFRDDFENAKLGCRIGNQLGHAQLVDSSTIRCTISNKLPLVEPGESLLVSAALNSYSWAPSTFSMQPYGIFELYPNSGPIMQNTNVLVTGKGFDNELKEQARCKFGTEDNYAIVEAQVLDNEHLICKSPSEEIALPDGAEQPMSLPFAVAFQEDLYFPYTEGPLKFRQYKQPTLTDIDPAEAAVGKLTEVYITADENNGFWQPMPSATGELNEQYGIKCKFGRFGTSSGTYINKTTILCLTPSISDDPSEISTETVSVSVAMNGVDFDDDDSDLTFQFIGTGGAISTWVIIMGTIIFGLLIVSIVLCLTGLRDWWKSQQFTERQRLPYTDRNEEGQQILRPASRASSANIQPRPRSFQNDSRAGAYSRAQNRFGSRAGGPNLGSQAAGHDLL